MWLTHPFPTVFHFRLPNLFSFSSSPPPSTTTIPIPINHTFITRYTTLHCSLSHLSQLLCLNFPLSLSRTLLDPSSARHATQLWSAACCPFRLCLPSACSHPIILASVTRPLRQPVQYARLHRPRAGCAACRGVVIRLALVVRTRRGSRFDHVAGVRCEGAHPAP